MRVPNADNATVAREKMVGYLLNPAHPVGGPKSAFFFAFGFTVARWQELEAALLLHVRDNPVTQVGHTVGADKYTVVGPLMTPDGRNPEVLTGWYITDGGTVPQFSTAYPA